MNNPLHQTLLDLAQFLQGQSLPFAVIGGIAVAVRGETRSTADVDLLVAMSVERACELLDQLEPSPFRPLFPGAAEVVEQAFILPLRHQQTGVRVDLALALSGFESHAVHRASSAAIAGGRVPVVTIEDLIIMKTLASRARDVDDVARLVSLRRDEIDWDYIFTTAEQLQKAVDQDLLGPLRKLHE